MKKILSYLTLSLGITAFATNLQADVAGIEVGTYQWTPDYTGNVSGNGVTNGTNIDIADDLGYSDDNHNIKWASLEHPLPFIPNFKIVSSALDASVTSPEGVNLTFNDAIYNEVVSTKIDFSNTEYTLYYEFLDNWINLDAGVTIRKYDGEMSLTGQTSNVRTTEVVDFTLPLFYLAGRVDLPFTGFFMDGQINIISYDDEKMSDTAISIGYESEIGLGAKAGYRTFDMEVSEDGFNADLEFSGSYISVFYHF